jgi:flagellar basal-body rod protein FlgC
MSISPAGATGSRQPKTRGGRSQTAQTPGGQTPGREIGAPKSGGPTEEFCSNFIDRGKARFADLWQTRVMSTVGAIALSGLNAATLRLEAAASNIANARSNGPPPGAANAAGHAPVYTPLEVNQTPNANGGVIASIAPATRSAVTAYDPDAPYADAKGMVAAPDTDIAEEVIQLITSRYAFAASLQTAKADAEMLAAALAITA